MDASPFPRLLSVAFSGHAVSVSKLSDTLLGSDIKGKEKASSTFVRQIPPRKAVAPFSLL